MSEATCTQGASDHVSGRIWMSAAKRGGRARSASQAERNTQRTNEGDHRRGAKVEDTFDVGRRLEDSRCTMRGREGAKGEMGRKGTLTGKHARIHAVEVDAVVRHGSDASFS